MEHLTMWWGSESGQRNLMWLLVGLVLAALLFVLLARVGGWPMFIFVFFIGPKLFRLFSHAWHSDSESERSKRKNDAGDWRDKQKNDAPADEPARYLITDDGELMEIVDEAEARETGLYR